jgi:hypothetical protein
MEIQRKSGSGVRVIRCLARPINVLAREQRIFGLPVRNNIMRTIALLFFVFPISMQEDLGSGFGVGDGTKYRVSEESRSSGLPQRWV